MNGPYVEWGGIVGTPWQKTRSPPTGDYYYSKKPWLTVTSMFNPICRLDDRHLRGSTASDLKLPPESDTDSIADYADGENAGKVQIQNQNTILWSDPLFE